VNKKSKTLGAGDHANGEKREWGRAAGVYSCLGPVEEEAGFLSRPELCLWFMIEGLAFSGGARPAMSCCVRKATRTITRGGLKEQYMVEL